MCSAIECINFQRRWLVRRTQGLPIGHKRINRSPTVRTSNIRNRKTRRRRHRQPAPAEHMAMRASIRTPVGHWRGWQVRVIQFTKRFREMFDDDWWMTVLFPSTTADPITHNIDHSHPPELQKLMLSLRCNLCNIESNSFFSAKIHYDSKVHEKKVRQWLVEWTARTGQPLPNTLHCKHCDIQFNSASHANQHYTGKKHRA